MTKGERSGRAPAPEPTLADVLAELRAIRDVLRRILAQQERRSPDHYHDATGLEHRGG